MQVNKDINAVESLLFFSLILKYLSFPTCVLRDSSAVHLLMCNMQQFLMDQTVQKCGELSLHTPVAGINAFCKARPFFWWAGKLFCILLSMYRQDDVVIV